MRIAALAFGVVAGLIASLILALGGLDLGPFGDAAADRQLQLTRFALYVIANIGVFGAGLVLGSILGAIGIVRIALWQWLGFYDYGPHWMLIAATVGGALIGIVTFGSMMGSMLPFLLKRAGFDPASASAPLVATLVDVTGLVIYFGVAALILSGTLL